MQKRALSVLLLLAAGPLAADDFTPAMRAYYEAEIAAWATDAVLVAAIREQNAMTTGYSQADIDRLDTTWRAEVGTAGSALIQGVMDHPASAVLRARQEASGGTITEMFLMDAKGMNVAASEVTSDYWQGDEAKFSETYPLGAGAVHFSEVEFDESTQTYQAQVSVTISDPVTGEVVGAMTVGLNAEALL